MLLVGAPHAPEEEPVCMLLLTCKPHSLPHPSSPSAHTPPLLPCLYPPEWNHCSPYPPLCLVAGSSAATHPGAPPPIGGGNPGAPPPIGGGGSNPGAPPPKALVIISCTESPQAVYNWDFYEVRNLYISMLMIDRSSQTEWGLEAERPLGGSGGERPLGD